MNPELFSDTDLNALALQVDAQLLVLEPERHTKAKLRVVEGKEQILVRSGSNTGAESRRVQRSLRTKLPAAPQQQALIEKAAGESFESFWEKFQRHARRDLCLPGGNLHAQWKKWRNLRSRDAVKMSLAALGGMGVSTANIPVLAVPATVFLLNAVANIGIEALCEGCAQEEGERQRALREAAKRKDQTR